MDGGNLVPKEGRPPPPGSIITREARYSQDRRATPGVQAPGRPGTRPGDARSQDRHSARTGREAPGRQRREAPGGKPGSSRACPSPPSTPRSSHRPGVALEVAPGVLACLDSQAVGPLRHAAAWCLPGALACLDRRDARPRPLVTAPGRPPGLVRLAGATRVPGCGWPVRRAVRCGGARPPPGAVRRAAREGDPPAWVFWLLANGREGHVPTPATNRLVAKPEKKYCGVCPMP